MEHAHKIEVPLAHQVEVGRATQLLQRCLECDDWYVASHQEHHYVCRFSRQGRDRYVAAFQCTPPVEKGIYHGSKAWALSIIPLHGVEDLSESKVQEIRRELAAAADSSHDQGTAGAATERV